MKKIRLTESQLHNVIKESIRKVLNENLKYKYIELADLFADANLQKEFDLKDGWYQDVVDEETAEITTYAVIPDVRYTGFYNDNFRHPYDALAKHSGDEFNKNNHGKSAMDTLAWLDDARKASGPCTTSSRQTHDIRHEKYKRAKDKKQAYRDNKSFQKALDSADKRPLHRKGSLNRA